MTRPSPSILSAVIAEARRVEPKWTMPADGVWVLVPHEILRGPGGLSDRPLSALTAGMDMNAKPGAKP